MFKEVVRSLETGDAALVGLVAFMVAFVLVVVRAFSLRKSVRTHLKDLPLED